MLLTSAVALVLLSAAAKTAAYDTGQAVFDSNFKHFEWTKFNSTIKRVAVIGAGPAGLQAAAGLIEHNFTVRLFDRAPGPGGNWFYSDEVPVRESYPDPPTEKPFVPDVLPSTRFYKDGDGGFTLDERWREHWLPRPVWNSLHTNSPAVITEFTDVKYPPDTPWVISNHLIQNHIRAYASVHRLNLNDYRPNSDTPVTSYSTRVEKVTKSGSIWTVTLRRLERLPESNRIKAEWWNEEFDAIVVATGPYDTAHVPDIDGLVEWSKVKHSQDGAHSVHHSRTYRRPERYTGKNVLVVGAGTSAGEIARDIDGYAKHIYASTRPHDTYHPFEIRALRRFPASAEFIPEIKSFGRIDSYDRGITRGKITLVNGTVLEGIDEVILATGYRRRNAFLSEILKDKDDGSDQKPFFGSRLKDTHWTGHYIPDPTLAFTTVRPYTLGKYQSLAFAKVWEGTARIPNEKELWRQYNDTTGRWNNFRGLFGTVASESIYRQFVAWLNNESLELGGRFVDSWPLENREVFVYYANQQWIQDYISTENFTTIENLPAKDWGKVAAWDMSVYEDDTW